MDLYFKCPEKDQIFQSCEYSLAKGYRIVLGEGGEKILHGRVILNSSCPMCGQRHTFDVKDVMCPVKKDDLFGGSK